MNNDGYLDLVGGVLKDNYGIFYWKGNATDTVSFVRNLGKELKKGSMADLDNDGDYDFIFTKRYTVSAGEESGYVLNSGTVSSPKYNWRDGTLNLLDTAGNEIHVRTLLTALDFDKDQNVDLLVTHRYEHVVPDMPSIFWKIDMSMVVYKNDGNNAYYPTDTIMTEDSLSYVEEFVPTFGDLNGDGILDMVYVFSKKREVYVKWGSYDDTKNTFVQKQKSFDNISIKNNVLNFSGKQHPNQHREMSVFNTRGKRVKRVLVSGESYNLNALTLSKGAYIISLKNGDYEQYIKWQNKD